MSMTRLNKRAVQQQLHAATRPIVNDVVRVVAHGVGQDAPRDTEFLAETVEAIGMGEAGQAPKVEQRRSQRTGESVERVSHRTPQLGADTAALHVAADYATQVEIREPFIWPNVEAAAQALPDIVAQRRV